jgi:NADH-quinone oxidoreductase subunit F
MEKPSLLPLPDGLLPLDEAKVAEAAREAGVPLAQAWSVAAYYPHRGLLQGRLLVDDPVARARGFARLRKEAEGTYPPLGLEALSPVYASRTERFVETQGVEVNPKDAQRLDLADGEPVYVVSRRGRIRARAWVTEHPRGGGLRPLPLRRGPRQPPHP